MRMTERQKVRRKELISLGKCRGHPSQNIVSGRKMCQKCVDWFKDYNARRYKESRALGKCAKHPDSNVVFGKSVCQRCRTLSSVYGKIRYRELLSRGKCFNHPDRDIVVGKTQCMECQIRDKNRMRAVNEERFGVSYPTWWFCDGCNKPISGPKIYLDHNHSTGVFRSWLCNDCNHREGVIRSCIKLGIFEKILMLAKN